MPGSFDNVVLAYQHPYIATYLEDNTIYNDTDTVFGRPAHPGS